MTGTSYNLSRRTALSLGGAAVATTAWRPARAADKLVHVPMNMPFTGGEAMGALLVKNGAAMAIDEINAKGGVAGYTLQLILMNDGTASAGGYDPGQAATNARRMVEDPLALVALGPFNSGSGKAMSPILSSGGLAIITPTSTNPDITDPKFAQVYHPSGPAIYFRTVTTDAFQGPNMANYFAKVLKVPNVYVLDDSGAYGVGIADSFQAQATKIGMKVLGRDRLDPKASDYTPILTKMKSLGVQALYYGGDAPGGIKLVKQSYDILPGIVKGGGDGMYESEILTGGGFPAADGWYATIAAPHLLDDAKAQAWVKKYASLYGSQPSDYCITAYDAVLVIEDAVKRVVASGKPMSRATMRDAIQATKIMTMQGEISFDNNGDLTSRIISVFQIKHAAGFPQDDMVHQYKYVGVAPQDAGA
jgi:branched-chain amino acid transport system substrate-binding protein